jgi:hypothetical protein
VSPSLPQGAPPIPMDRLRVAPSDLRAMANNLTAGSRVNLNAVPTGQQDALIGAIPTLMGMPPGQDGQIQALKYLEANNLLDPLNKVVPTESINPFMRSVGSMKYGVPIPDTVPADQSAWGLSPQAEAMLPLMGPQLQRRPLTDPATLPPSMIKGDMQSPPLTLASSGWGKYEQPQVASIGAPPPLPRPRPRPADIGNPAAVTPPHASAPLTFNSSGWNNPVSDYYQPGNSIASPQGTDLSYGYAPGQNGENPSAMPSSSYDTLMSMAANRPQQYKTVSVLNPAYHAPAATGSAVGGIGQGGYASGSISLGKAPALPQPAAVPQYITQRVPVPAAPPPPAGPGASGSAFYGGAAQGAPGIAPPQSAGDMFKSFLSNAAAMTPIGHLWNLSTGLTHAPQLGTPGGGALHSILGNILGQAPQVPSLPFAPLNAAQLSGANPNYVAAYNSGQSSYQPTGAGGFVPTQTMGGGARQSYGDATNGLGQSLTQSNF